MHHYRIFSLAYRRITRLVYIAGALLAAVVTALLVRVVSLLENFHPHGDWVGAGVLIGLLGIILRRIGLVRRQHRILRARHLRLGDQPSHKQRVALLRHLIHCGRRISHQRLLTRDEAASTRTLAHELEQVLHHHPLIDDLDRAIASAQNDMIAPAFKRLDAINEKITQSKALAVIEDVYFPPFPLFTPLVVAYHQFTLTAEIADIYLTRPSLLEYVQVMQDVWRVMNEGHFSRKGRYVFAKLDQADASPAMEELGHAFSMIWLTYCVSMIAAQRCRTLYDWDVKNATDEMMHNIDACLRSSYSTFHEAAMPMLKKRLRRYAPVSDVRAQAFADDIASSVSRALDAAIHSPGSASSSASMYNKTSYVP